MKTLIGRRRGISGLGAVLVVVGVVVLAVTYSWLPAFVYRLWPLILVGVGLFGLLRRPGWVNELDLLAGPDISRAAARPHRWFSWLLVSVGLIFLVFSLGFVDQRVIGPALIIVLGLLLIWRRAR